MSPRAEVEPDAPTARAPAVSVLMPVYNAARHLSETVESILGQTFTDFEFLIIDDGSTDDSGPILGRFAAADRRIRLTRRPNADVVATRNELLAMARGELLAVMDADDVALPHRLERQVAFLAEHPEVVVVGSQTLLIDEDGDPLRPWLLATGHEEIDRAHMEGHGGVIIHPSAVVRAWAMRAVGGYRPETNLAEDLDLWLRLAEIGRLANLPEVLLKYRRHLESAGAARRQEQFRNAGLAIREARQRRGLAPAESPWTRDEAALSVAAHLRMWGWWALEAGNIATARKHASRALRECPWSLESWRLMTCALRGG